MTREVISYIIKLRLLDSFLEETIFSLCLSSVLNKSRLLRMSQSSVMRRKRLIQCPGWLECNERVLNRFYEIRDFPYLKLGIRELRAKSRRDSGLKVCGRVRMPEMTLGITRNFKSGLRDWRTLLGTLQWGESGIVECYPMKVTFIRTLYLASQ